MRLLHILAERGYSGGEEQLRMLLEHLDAQGHENRLVLQPGAKFADTAERLELPVDLLRMRNSLDPFAWRGIRRLVARHRPDLLHLACSRSHKLGAVAMRGDRRPVMIATRRLADPLRHGFVSRWLYGRAVEATIAVSRATREAIIGVGVSPARVVLIEDGVRVERYTDLVARRAEAGERLGLPDSQAPLILCAATLRPRKGQVWLLKAFAEIVERHPRARLLLAGEGDQEAALRAEIADLGLSERAFLPGRYLPIEDCLAVADLVCVPSRFEGLSVFALESMAAGLPVVASRAGGLPEAVIDGETGVLVEPGDVAGIAAALDRLLSDPELGRKMGKAGASHVRASFSARMMAEKTERLYEELIASVK